MKITITECAKNYNRALRRYDYTESFAGASFVPDDVATAIRRLRLEYGLSVSDMVVLALTCYFGDGKDHLACEHCIYSADDCTLPERGGQTHAPLLDNGGVVVGLSTSEQGV